MAPLRSFPDGDGHWRAHSDQRRDHDLSWRVGRLDLGEERAPSHTNRYSIATASGFIAGEAIVAVIIPLLVTLGLIKLAS